MFLFFLFFVFFSIEAFETEFQAVFKNLTDKNHPTTEDYIYLEDSLKQDIRPVLPWGSCDRFIKVRRNMRFVDAKTPQPLIRRFAGQREFADTVVISYATCNPPYPAKISYLERCLRKVGYKGDILLQVGGFPNVQEGDLELAGTPYAFKVALFRYAASLGYKNILWMDTALKPQKGMDSIFLDLDQNGFLFIQNDWDLHEDFKHGVMSQAYLDYMGTSPQELVGLPRICCALFGFSLKHEKGKELLEVFYDLTKKIYPYLNEGPEEIPLAIVLKKMGIQATAKYSILVGKKFERKKTKQVFVHDSDRPLYR